MMFIISVQNKKKKYDVALDNKKLLNLIWLSFIKKKQGFTTT